MTVIKWRDAYNTGVEQFDQEHHKIVELIDIMFVAIRDKSEKEIILTACNDVLSYTDTHFANEEEAMRAIEYPELEEHIAEHARLKDEATKFYTILSNNFPEGRNQFYRFLRDWLIEHILECDKKYGSYLSKATEAK